MAAAAEIRGKPVVIITGAAGNLGTSIAGILKGDYEVVGLDRSSGEADFPIIEADLTNGRSIAAALKEVGKRYGNHLASVIHLAAFFDFSGEEGTLHPGAGHDVI